MKKFSGTLVALALFGAMLAFLLIAKPKGADERKEAALTLTSSPRESIDRIEVTNTNGAFVMARVPGATPEAWKITSPADLALDDAVLNQMKNALSDLVAVDPVWPNATAAERAQVGLDPAASRVTWHGSDGDHTLMLGKPFAKRDQVYAQVKGQPGVFVVRKYAVEVFGKKLNDFRRHKLFELDRDAVRSITVETHDAGTLAATRTDVLAPWTTTTPFVGRADRGKLNNLIAKIAGLRAEEFANAPDPKQGLGVPRAKITLTTADGTAHTLRVGAEATEGKWFGQAGPLIFTSGAQIPADLKAPFPAWRDRTLVDFPVEDVATLELTLDGSTRGFHRDETKSFVANAGGANVNPEVSQFLRTAKTATVTDRVEIAKGPSFGFEKPALSASWLAGTSKFEVTVGAAKGTAHWVKTGESPAALLVGDDLVAAARALVNAAAPKVTSTAGAPAATKGI